MPAISRFGARPGAKGQEAQGVTWVDVDIADADERAWLDAWTEIGDQARTLLLEPVRLSRRDHTADGMFLGVRSMRTGATADVDHLTDLKLLIGQSQVVTVRLGGVAAVDELRQALGCDKGLVTPVDLLAYMVGGMTRRMEGVIFDVSTDTDAAEDRMLDDGAVLSPDTLTALRRRIFYTRRQLKSIQQVIGPIATDPVMTLDADDRKTLVRLSNHVTNYLDSLEDSRVRVQMLEDHQEAQREAAMTRSSLNLTIVATIFLPMTFLSGLLGMNVAGIPDEHDPWGFWVVTGFMLVVALLAWVVLRRRLRDLESLASPPGRTHHRRH